MTSDKQLIFFLALSTNIVQFISAFFAAYLSTKYGRKTLLLRGDIMCFFFLALFGMMSFLKESNIISAQITNSIAAFCVFAYIFAYGISLGPIVWAYNSEILPEKALSLATMTNWMSSIVIIFCFPIVISTISISYVFFFFAFVCAFAAFFI